MKDEQKQDFTRRIANSNRSSLVVITYEIAFAYLEEAQEKLERQDKEGFVAACKNASAVIERLKEDLDLHYSLSTELYPLYHQGVLSIAKAISLQKRSALVDAREILQPLYEGFVEVAKQDDSLPLTKNAQKVVTGMTYSKGQMSEILYESEHNRGFLV